MGTQNSFVDQLATFIANAKTKAADGLTIQEAGQIAYAFVLLAVDLATTLDNSGADKKALVMEALGVLYDTIAPAVPLPFALKIIYPFVASSLRQMFVQLGSGAIEAAYNWIKSRGA